MKDIYIPCAADPGKMLPGIANKLVAFPTQCDRKLFAAAVNLAFDHKLMLFDAIHISYGIAADIAPAMEGLSYNDDFTMFVGKGILSPFVAVLAAQKQHTGDGVPMVARHVWLRTSIGGAFDSDCAYTIDNGRPDGKGGSYRATIVVPVGYKHSYDVAVTVPSYPCRLTKQWLEAWDAFTASLVANPLADRCPS